MMIKNKLKGNKGIFWITIIFFLIFFAMLPLRETGFEDDFAYARSVKNFLETGRFIISDWSSSALIFQVIWGAFFSQIFGFSFKTLQFSVFVFLYIGTIGLYYIFRHSKLSQFKAALFALFFVVNPWVLIFTFSFLTDIPYVSLLIITLLFYLTGLSKRDNLLLFLASITGGLSFLIRQIGISLLGGVFFGLILESIYTRTIKWKRYVASIMPFAVIVGVYLLWTKNPANITVAYRYTVQKGTLKGVVPYLWPKALGLMRITNDIYLQNILQRITFYLNQLIIPIAPVFIIFAAIPNIRKIYNWTRKNLLGLSISLLAFLFFYAWEIIVHYARPHYDPNCPNFIFNYDRFSGIPWRAKWLLFTLIFLPVWSSLTFAVVQSAINLFTKAREKSKTLLLVLVSFTVCIGYFYFLRENYLVGGLEGIQNSWFFGLMVSMLVWILILILFTRKFIHFDFSQEHTGKIFLAFAFFIQLGLTLFTYYNWGQYIIPFLPFLFITIVLFTKNLSINKKLAVAVLVINLFFTLQVAKFRHDEKGMMWEQGLQLVEQGIDPLLINVGEFAWRPWFVYEETLEKEIQKVGGKENLGGFGFWPRDTSVIDYDFVFLNGNQSEEKHFDNREVIKKIEFRSLFIPRTVYVVKNQK